MADDRAFATQYAPNAAEIEAVQALLGNTPLPPDAFGQPVAPEVPQTAPTLLGGESRAPGLVEPVTPASRQQSTSAAPAPGLLAGIGGLLGQAGGFLDRNRAPLLNALGSGLAMMSGPNLRPTLLPQSLAAGEKIAERVRQQRAASEVLGIQEKVAQARESGDTKGALGLLRQAASRTDLDPETSKALGTMIMTESAAVQKAENLKKGMSMVKSGSSPAEAVHALISADVSPDAAIKIANLNREKYNIHFSEDGTSITYANKENPSDVQMIMTGLDPNGNAITKEFDADALKAVSHNPEIFGKYKTPKNMLREVVKGNKDALADYQTAMEGWLNSKERKDSLPDRISKELYGMSFEKLKDPNQIASVNNRIIKDQERVASLTGFAGTEARTRAELGMLQDQPIVKVYGHDAQIWDKQEKRFVSNMNKAGVVMGQPDRFTALTKQNAEMVMEFQGLMPSLDRMEQVAGRVLADSPGANIWNVVKLRIQRGLSSSEDAAVLEGLRSTLRLTVGAILNKGRPTEMDAEAAGALMPSDSDTVSVARAKMKYAREMMNNIIAARTGDPVRIIRLEDLPEEIRKSAPPSNVMVTPDGSRVKIPGGAK